MAEWITERRPNLCDADRFGCVLLKDVSIGAESYSVVTRRYAYNTDKPWRHTSNWHREKASADFNTATITLQEPDIEPRRQWLLRRAKGLTQALASDLDAERFSFIHDRALELTQLAQELQEDANHD